MGMGMGMGERDHTLVSLLKTAAAMALAGGSRAVHIANWAKPCASSMSLPDTCSVHDTIGASDTYYSFQNIAD